jgi:hypothetical protein
MCTVIALSTIFITPTVWFPVFLAASVAVIIVLPKIAPWFFAHYGDRVIEPEIKLVFAVLFGLMVLGDEAKSQAVLPAFVLGLVMSRHYQQHHEEQRRLRVVAFAFLTPFFFLRGGINVSLAAVFANLGILAVLVAAKSVPKAWVDLPTRPQARIAARGVHDATDEHRADVRDDQRALRTDRAHHRPHPILAPSHGGGALRDRPDRGRATLVLAASHPRTPAPRPSTGPIRNPHPRPAASLRRPPGLTSTTGQIGLFSLTSKPFTPTDPLSEGRL